jgi:hypothetical protein
MATRGAPRQQHADDRGQFLVAGDTSFDPKIR